MTRSTLFLFLCSFFLQRAWSQSVKWSSPLSDERKLPYVRILGAGENGYYLLRSNVDFSHEKKSKSRKFELQFYANDLSLKWSEQLAPPCEDCRIADIELVSGHLIMLVSQFEKKKKLLNSLVQKFDDAGKPSG